MTGLACINRTQPVSQSNTKHSQSVVNMARLLLIFLPTVLTITVNYEYKAFDSCGMGGWSCRNTPQGYEVVFRCSTHDRNARLWMWTARIPTSATIIAIENCDHVEVHPDCTMGYRGYTMRTFRASNIGELEFLKPLAPYVFLHDNDQAPHMPPEVILENIGKVTTYSGIFDRTRRRCRTKQQYLEVFSARNVTMEQFLDNQFTDQVLESFQLIGVKFSSSERMALSVNANVTITNTTFDSATATGTMALKGAQVSLKNNHFLEMMESSLSVKSHNFEFEGNTISLLKKGSLDILSKNVTIMSNTFLNVETEAFASIKPSSGPTVAFEAAKKAIFRFKGNTVQEMEAQALHPDIQAYNATCSEFIIQNNQLPCHCPEFKWSTPLPSLQFFYDQFSITNNENFCYHHPKCNLAQALLLKSNCSLLPSCELPDNDTLLSTTEEVSQTTEINKQELTTRAPLPQTSKRYYMVTTLVTEDSTISAQTAHTTNVSIMLVFGAILLFVVCIGSAALLYFYKQRKRAEVVGPVYQNQCRSDYDEQNLIDE